MDLSSSPFSSTGCCELKIIFQNYLLLLLKESRFSLNLDLKSGSDSVFFSEFWRKLFQMDGPLNEILNLLLLNVALGMLQLNCEKIVGYPWPIFSKLPKMLKVQSYF